MVDLPVTSLTTAFCGLLLLLLAMMTVRRRFQLRVGFGDGGDRKLIAAGRSHGNLAEHAPIVLIMLGLVEAGGANRVAVATVAVAFCIGRILHVVGLHTPSEGGPPPSRALGVMLTWVVLAALSGMLVVQATS